MIKTKYREIAYTQLEPVLFHELETFEAQSAHRNLPVIWDYAKDFQVWDINGNKYIDFTSGIFVANAGHSNSYIKEAIRKQMTDNVIYAYTFPTQIRAKLLNRLIEITPDFCEKAFLLSTGAEAVECAVKLMRLYSKRDWILSFKDSMHGKTALTEQLSKNSKWGKDNYIAHFVFPKEYEFFTHIRSYLKESELNKKTAGIVIESYQGWSARFYPKRYIQELIKWAKENNILICFDEVQSGFGRTGKLFAYQHYDVEPDLICIGKGFGGGLPISAVVGRKEILDIADDLSSTHSSNALCCAGALANINYIIDNNLIEKSRDFGFYLAHSLETLKNRYNYIIEVNHRGLLGAIIFKNKDIATKVCYKAMKKGLLLVYTGRESVKIGPPLTIPLEALFEGLNVLKESIEEIIK